MSQMRVLTLISVLLLAVVVGCSSSDQGAIDKAVSATLTATQPANAAPTATSTPEPLPTVTPAATATSAPTPLPVFSLEIDPVLEPVRFLESLPASEVSCAADALDSKDRFVEIIQYVFGSQEGIDVPTEAESSVMDKCISEETVAAIFSGKLYLEIGGISDKTHVCIREKFGGYPFTRIFLENSPDSDVFFSFLQGLFCLNGQERSELSQSDLSLNEIGGMDAIECFVNELGHKGAAVFTDPEFASLLDPHSDILFVMIECGLLDEAEFEKEFGVSLKQFLCVIGEIDTEAGLEFLFDPLAATPDLKFLSDPLAATPDLSPIELLSILSSCGLTLEDIVGDASLPTEPPSTSFPTPPTVVPAPTVPPMVKPDTEIVDGEATKITKAPEVPLLIAIQNEDLETVLAHISYGTDLNDTYRDALGTLHVAVLRYNLEVVDALIRAGVNIEMRTKDQLEFTPLLLATWFGKLKMVELLVESGADLEATDGFGANALQVSMEDNPNIPESQLESFNERRKQTYLFLEAWEPVEAPEVPFPTATPVPTATATPIPTATPTPIPIEYSLKVCKGVKGQEVGNYETCNEVTSIRQLLDAVYFEAHAFPYFEDGNYSWTITGPKGTVTDLTTNLADANKINNLKANSFGDSGTYILSLYAESGDNKVKMASKEVPVQPFDWISDWATLETVNYEELIRNSDNYGLKLFQISGDIFQVLAYDEEIYKTYPTDEYQMWLESPVGEKFDQPGKIFIRSGDFSRLMEDDVIDAVGKFVGLQQVTLASSNTPVYRPLFQILALKIR